MEIIAGIEFTHEQAMQLVDECKLLVKGKCIYQVEYSQGQIYVRKLPYKADKTLTRPGRFAALTSSEVNNLVGFKLMH